MNFYFRILIFSVTMAGIAISSLAGIKQCRKLSLVPSTTIVTAQRPESTSDTSQIVAGKLCNTVTVFTQSQNSKQQPDPGITKEPFWPKLFFFPQQYINPPFAPPQLAS